MVRTEQGQSFIICSRAQQERLPTTTPKTEEKLDILKFFFLQKFKRKKFFLADDQFSLSLGFEKKKIIYEEFPFLFFGEEINNFFRISNTNKFFLLYLKTICLIF